MIPVLTDTDGWGTFDELTFSLYGRAGTFRIKFACEGKTIITRNIEVKTSVRYVEVIKEPPKVIKEEVLSLETALAPIIRITDTYGKGVKGKTPLVKIVK